MMQVARPASDVSNVNWGPTPLFAHIGAPAPNDPSPVSTLVPPGGVFAVQLAPAARPITGTHTLTVRLNKTDPCPGLLTFALLQGGRTIAARSVQPTQPFTNYDLVLTEDEVDLIADYTDLQLLVLAGAAAAAAPARPAPGRGGRRQGASAAPGPAAAPGRRRGAPSVPGSVSGSPRPSGKRCLQRGAPSGSGGSHGSRSGVSGASGLSGSGLGSGSGSGSGGSTVGCGNCPNGAPYQYKFTISGVTNGNCTNCAVVNGLTIVTSNGGGFTCSWTNTAENPCGGGDLPWNFWIYDNGTCELAWSTGEAMWTASTAGWDCFSPLR